MKLKNKESLQNNIRRAWKKNFREEIENIH